MADSWWLIAGSYPLYALRSALLANHTVITTKKGNPDWIAFFVFSAGLLTYS